MAQVLHATLNHASVNLGIPVESHQRAVGITPEEQVVVREYVKTNPVVVERPSNFELVLGAIIPDILKPGALADNKYQYVVMDGRTVLIDPQTRKVVYIMD